MFLVRKAALAVAAGVTAILSFGPASAYAAAATIPFGQNQVGTATYYHDAGFGACGTQINAGGSPPPIRTPTRCAAASRCR
jgi:hypothetical protein